MIGKKNTTEEMRKMQEEAIKRVKEMHLRSKTSFQGMREKVTPGNVKPDITAKKAEVKPETKNTFEKNQAPQKKNSNFNLRKTRVIKDTPEAKNINFKSTRKKESPLNIMGNLPNFMDLIFKDPDKSLLITLIILLMDDEENFIILLVLFYLLI